MAQRASLAPHHCTPYLLYLAATKTGPERTTSVDEALYSSESEAFNPEDLLLHRANAQFLREVLEELPVEFREVILLRELEGLSYKGSPYHFDALFEHGGLICASVSPSAR